MKPEELEGIELEKRAKLFQDWLELPATMLYFDIINNKRESLTRQLTETVGIDNVGYIQGQIKALKGMVYLPTGVLKTYERELEKTKEVQNATQEK